MMLLQIPADSPAQVRTRPTKAPRALHRTGLSLALQGGGAFGSFTWGVLDGLLESGIPFDLVSGASAGAMNAVLLASGLLEGGPEAAQDKLARFWRGLSDAGPARGAVDPGSELSPFMVSPYLFNPLGLNPLRDLLRAEVDFARLRAERPL